MPKFLGWAVEYEYEEGKKIKRKVLPEKFQVRSAAQDFCDLYQKSYPDHKAYVTMLIRGEK